MRDFTFFNPTRIEFGKGKEANIGLYLKEFGVDSALILYGSERVKKNGLFDRVAASLGEQGIAFVELGGVISNPLISRVRDAVKIAKEKDLQAVVAVGGGSVLDSAKAVAAGAKYVNDVWDFFVGKAVVEAALPVFSIMTLAATGSEMNMAGVVTNDETRQKYAIVSPLLFPKVSVINPELMASVPRDYLAYSAVDVFSHCLDLYFSASYLPEFSAELIEAILKTVMRTTDALLKNSNDYDARGEFAWAATMALNGNTFVGVEGNTYDTHMIEHAMSALYNVPHGAGLAVVLPAWLKDIKNQMPERFERFADKVFGASGVDAGIDKLTEWFSTIGAPVTFAQAGLSEDAVDPIAENAFGNAKLWKMDTMYPQERISKILKLAV
ncbi:MULTISPECIES: iron-containing alcohol dehydrogenase [Syntrophotalea]|uniref:Butanol dehydrogenase n=1 Tax=Syntrophotalea acetylenica TaxID=29542 RepID=A0A1L3GIP0_SYNAC|nr:iron-containing alcohol dehydrogenase [Syntrophotalea acetylenica]APG25802.1 butanol dehydrogenase [Syntrophotalea acetylenica]APG43873.1 butanol dehydrogenase [Syntrophotalea acetylenica]MDY0262306.1 iron-containing alcohol dehydrogenase [Syntrophotalea acetylenica]